MTDEELLKRYRDTGLEPEEVEKAMEDCADTVAENQFAISDINEMGGIDHLRDLVQAEKDGRLVVLPVPVGAGKIAYGLTDPGYGPQRIVNIECDYLEKLEIWDNLWHEVVVEVDGWEIGESDIGKTVFLTRKGAESELKKREEADNETD